MIFCKITFDILNQSSDERKYMCNPKYRIKGAVSYRFSQGLLTLMCNNSKSKADINFFFFLLRRQTSEVYN